MTYQSDITRFINELKAKQPELERKQREGRALLWDKPQDLEEARRQQAARVRQQAYVYQTKAR